MLGWTFWRYREIWVCHFSRSPQLGVSICLFSIFDQFPQKSLLWFPGHQLFWCELQKTMGKVSFLHCIKKLNLAFLFLNFNAIPIIQMRKLLKNLKLLCWVFLVATIYSMTWNWDNFSWFGICHHNYHFPSIERSSHSIYYCHSLLGLLPPPTPKFGFSYARFSNRLTMYVWEFKTVAYKLNSKLPFFVWLLVI